MPYGRGQSLSTLRTLLKAELRDAQETNDPEDTTYNYMLAMQQRDFCLQFDWPFLEHRWDLSCTAGGYYFTLPTTDIRGATQTINWERPVKVERLYGSRWYEVFDGIGTLEYSILPQGSQLDPIQRWRMDTNSNEPTNPNQIEVWPTPATTQTIRFTGQRLPQALAVDADTADLDDLLLVWSVAATILAERGNPRAAIVLQKAQAHLRRLQQSYPREDVCTHMGYKPRRTVLPFDRRPILVASAP